MQEQEWEPQIRTNLEHPVYQELLEGVVARTPNVQQAGFINLRFAEGCGHGEVGPVAASDVDGLVSLAVNLFGSEAWNVLEGTGPEPIGPARYAYLQSEGEAVIVGAIPEHGLVVALVVSSSLNLGASSTLLESVQRQLARAPEGPLGDTLGEKHDVLGAVVVRTGDGTVAERYERYGASSSVALEGELYDTIRALVTTGRLPQGLCVRGPGGERVRIVGAEIATASEVLFWRRVPFDPDHVAFLRAGPAAVRGLMWLAVRHMGNEAVRTWVDGLLEYGVPTAGEPAQVASGEATELVGQLHQLHENDLLGRLAIGGFANHTVGEGAQVQRCQECAYYLATRRWCDLPELTIPVEGHWWCRLWKA